MSSKFTKVGKPSPGKRSYKSRLLTLLFGTLLALTGLAAAPALANPATAQSQEDMDKLKPLSGQEFETEFMKMMIGHHQSAIDMSKLAPDRAMRQEVKDIAQKIMADQTREISDMTGWLKQWYNVEPGAMMGDMGGMGMGMSDAKKLEGLKGDDFDREFLTMMRAHHMSAVDMAQLVPDRSTRSELQKLAQNIISSQQAEIQQFDSWLQAWYNVAAPTGTTTGNTMSGDMSGENMGDLPSAGSGDGGTGMPVSFVWALALAGMIVAGGVWLRLRTQSNQK